MTGKMFSRGLIGVVIFLFLPLTAFAQEKFPSDPIRLIITHAAGGTNDLVARLIQPYAKKALGVPVVIENMVGAGGNTARGFVYKQKPDGYILLLSKQGSTSGGEILSGGKFQTLKFVHIYNIAGRNYTCVAVPYDSPIMTIEDLKKASLTQPLISAGTGAGTNAFMVAMLLKKVVGVDLIYVPFNSGTEAGMAIAGGKTQMGVANLDGLDVLHEQKKIRILALAGPQRDEFYSKIPTLAELGYPQVALDELVGVFAPPGLPKERLNFLEKAFENATADPEFKAAAAKASIGLFPLSSAEFFKASKNLHDMIYDMQDLLKTDGSK